MRPNPWAVILVYVVGLISPEAVTTETSESCLATFAVCTVTTPLFAWLMLNTTIPAATATPPRPIPTFCHVFILFLSKSATDHPRGDTPKTRFISRFLLLIRPCRAKCFAARSQSYPSARFPQRTVAYRSHRGP